MCGIAGIFHFQTGLPVDAPMLKAMTRSISHRGPDDEGFHLSGSLGLGFRRLSIIDLSAGHQPMSDREKTVWVVFNGEIYNFRELRRELESHGHIFQTNSDTEVIVHGYKQWGRGVLARLNGMFGLGIWDERQRRLIVARDAMGIKPVYYSIKSGSLLFGSEIRAVLAGLGSTPGVDATALHLFLRYRFTPSPLTMVEGVRKLAPGEMIEVGDGRAIVSRWYHYDPIPYSPEPGDDEARESLLGLYKDAVKRHLISDVPVGLLLSGGMDSGLLLALMSQHGNSWRTFTMGYGKSYRHDELEEAAETARLYSAPNSAVRLDRPMFEKALPRIVNVLEEPVASSSIVPMFFVCERAREEVKVALIGQGPDELFGGYKRHLGIHYGSYWRRLPSWLRSPAEKAMNAVPRWEALKRASFSLSTEDRLRRYQNVFSLLPGPDISSLFQDGLLPADTDDKILECWRDISPAMKNLDELNGLQLIELRSALADELLMYSDKLSMVHGLEVRVPFLDREVVESAQRYPARFKVRHGVTKWLHRQVCRAVLPATIVNRKKRGFGVNVVDDWFHSSLNGKMDERLLDEKSLMYQYLRPASVRRLLDEHRSRKKDNHKILFSLVVLEQWLRTRSS